jgi:hypothetical protein
MRGDIRREVERSASRPVPEKVRTPAAPLGRAAGFPPGLAGSLSPHSIRHAFATLNQSWTPGTTRHYDCSRGNLDRSPGCCLLAGVHQPAC